MKVICNESGTYPQCKACHHAKEHDAEYVGLDEQRNRYNCDQLSMCWAAEKKVQCKKI